MEYYQSASSKFFCSKDPQISVVINHLYTSLMIYIIFICLEHSHMATSNCEGGWEMQSSCVWRNKRTFVQWLVVSAILSKIIKSCTQFSLSWPFRDNLTVIASFDSSRHISGESFPTPSSLPVASRIILSFYHEESLLEWITLHAVWIRTCSVMMFAKTERSQQGALIIINTGCVIVRYLKVSGPQSQVGREAV